MPELLSFFAGIAGNIFKNSVYSRKSIEKFVLFKKKPRKNSDGNNDYK